MTKTERKAHQDKMNRIYTENRAIVATGKCPCCGRKIERNLSIAGWWQCTQLGAPTHRADPSQPSCNWQVFTE